MHAEVYSEKIRLLQEEWNEKTNLQEQVEDCLDQMSDLQTCRANLTMLLDAEKQKNAAVMEKIGSFENSIKTLQKSIEDYEETKMDRQLDLNTVTKALQESSMVRELQVETIKNHLTTIDEIRAKNLIAEQEIEQLRQKKFN